MCDNQNNQIVRFVEMSKLFHFSNHRIVELSNCEIMELLNYQNCIKVTWAG